MKINKKLSHKGSTNGNWKGGITKIYDSIRTSTAYSYWRKEIIERDNHMCKICGTDCKEEKQTIVDHYPLSFSSILLKNKINSLEEAYLCIELWNIENGRVLCKSCNEIITGELNRIDRAINNIYRLVEKQV